MILFVLAAAAVLAVVAVVLCYRGTLYTSPEERRIRSLKPLNHEPKDAGWGTKGRLR